MADQDDPIERFLEQPAEHGVDDDDVTAPRPARARGFWKSVNHFLFEKEPSDYSSIAPRGADGRRTKLFFFNGNGRGR
ncbi:MAG: hypothetical protein KGJ39_07485 [Acidobacteriota bacterium]|nr:hypothetical protein [Acidobacteriota bacterium]